MYICRSAFDNNAISLYSSCLICVMCNYCAMPDAIRLLKLLTQMYIGTPTRGMLVVTILGATGDCLLLVSYDVMSVSGQWIVIHKLFLDRFSG